MKVAIVHDWLVDYRGGERVLEAICELYPQAPIYTLFFDAKRLPSSLKNRDIRYPKFLKPFGFLRKALLPFLPTFIEAMPLSSFDLIISTSSCVAKGVIPSPMARHICYLHSPMRYIWDQKEEYLGRLLRFWPTQLLVESLLRRLRIWDVCSSARVDQFVVNSTFVGQRVARYYRREFKVIPPPVDLAFFKQAVFSPKKQYFLVFGAFVPYKRFDLAIQACNELGVELVVAGNGPLEKKLRHLGGPSVRFVVNPTQEEVRELFSQAKALIFPQIEDFGISAIEALAAGAPLIALKKGGALDFVEEQINGFFFAEQTVESLKAALLSFDSFELNQESIVKSSESFDKCNFLQRFAAEVEATIRTMSDEPKASI